MFKDIFKYFFLKKADYSYIESILEKESFIYTSEDIFNILKGNQKGIRYGNIVLERNENNQKQKRFLKIMLDGSLRTYKLFCRQVKVTNALYEDKKVVSPTMAVVQFSIEPPIPYSIFETLENGENFGFMSDSSHFYEKFTEQEMKSLVDTIYSFHLNGTHVDSSIWKYTQNITSDLNYYKKEFKKLLNTKIVHKLADGKFIQETVEKLLIMHTGIMDVRDRIFRVLEENWEYVISSEIKDKYYIVHADMQIDNVYRHKDGSFELLDFEWVGRSDNPVTAIMYDYGNLRARAWSSPAFQLMLDKMMLEVGKKYYTNTNLINAGLKLGILRSSLMMSRYHLDFRNTVKKDKRTEEDYQKMYPKTLAVLKQVLENKN